jgi:dephospho-CoA kinase
MKVVGITGSIAMGKSEVTKILRNVGVPVFDADEVVHELYASQEGADLLRPLAPNAVSISGVDRKKLSQVILEDSTLLPKVETAVHQIVAAKKKDYLERCQSLGESIVAIDVPLLFETDQQKNFNTVIVVSTPATAQKARALARPGMTEEKLAMIQKRQMPDAEKRARADFIIENNGSLADLRERTLAVLAQIREK